MPSILDKIGSLFTIPPSAAEERKKLRASLDAKIQEQKVYMNQRIVAMRQAAKKVEILQEKALKETDPHARNLLIQKLCAEKKNAERYRKHAEDCLRTIAALESEKTVLDLADDLTVAFGEEMSFDGVMKDMAIVARQYAQFNTDLTTLENQASQLSSQLLDGDPNAEAEIEDVAAITDLVRRIQTESDPVKRAELERQFQEMTAIPEVGGAVEGP